MTFSPMPPPTDPGPTADFYDTIRYLQRMAKWLGTNAIAAAFNVRTLMTEQAQLATDVAANTAAVAQIGTNLTALSTQVDVDIKHLADEMAKILPGPPPPSIANALAALEASNAALGDAATQISTLTSSLATSDAIPDPTPPAPTPTPTPGPVSTPSAP